MIAQRTSAKLAPAGLGPRSSKGKTQVKNAKSTRRPLQSRVLRIDGPPATPPDPPRNPST